ncbi:phage terminase large subunit family protein [Virgibacillus salexigens]|uniref:Large terminase protein n=1 Tax=Virgibacillus massiliensis TaxID=1462526 RepID=A0A024QIP5_9BACI|nr:phage terminase large subunit family protein [Virgibacillus massiliensis]CDQ41831.1 large terminase protein [Virgibacillus massiliensis]
MSEEAILDKEEMQEVEREIRSDPVKWAYWKLKDPKGNPWKARWYQEDMIKDIMNGTRRIAARMGRRVGKTETMVVFCLWYAFHHKNARLLITTPYEHQVRLIFMRLQELINDCDELANSSSSTKNPFITSFNNGSKIMGFTVGATQGQSGASVRGQRADFIFMDEIDYMNRDGIDAVTAIAMEDPKRIGIWVSSTPTGKRDFFYDVCTNPDTGYKAYHFPSMVNPDFDETMEAEMRATMTEQGYIHEVEAEFGEETVGVFNKAAVERAKSQFLYAYRELNVYEKAQYKKSGIDLNDITYMPEYTMKNQAPPAVRIVGTDWDKFGAATQIIVTEFDELRKKFRVAKRYEITRGEWTYDNAVQKLIEINTIWNPKFFYIDAGHGEYQIEALRKHGRDNPESGMLQKVKRIHFSEKIEIRDPGSREIDKKDAKNFMVNQTSILLERDQIILSPFDDMVWKQMMDYQVLRISKTGKPEYTSENEHALDAFMLTILGFTIEFPDIAKILEKINPARKAFVKEHGNSDRLREKAFGRNDDVFQTKKKRIPEPKDNPNWYMEKVPMGYSKKRTKSSFGARGSSRSKGFKRSTF